jgi:hypothetical protein
VFAAVSAVVVVREFAAVSATALAKASVVRGAVDGTVLAAPAVM